MARVKRMTREETMEARRLLAERAAAGELRLPEAVTAIRHTLGMTQEQFGTASRPPRRQVTDRETGAGNPTAEPLSRIPKPFGFAVGFVPIRPKPKSTG